MSEQQRSAEKVDRKTPTDHGKPTQRPPASASAPPDGAVAPDADVSRGLQSRRTVLRAALGVAGTAAAGATLTSRAQRVSAARATPPGTPIAASCELPKSSPDVPDAFQCLPDPFQSVAQRPGGGGTVNLFSITYSPPPPPRDENRYWQELERRLGVTWEPNLSPQAEYGQKAAALFAGGDLPDLFYVNPQQDAYPLYDAIDQEAFADLTPYLTGDALQDYPNLAAFPEYLWRNVAIRGSVYGVPRTTSRSGYIPFYRADWAERLGLTTPTNADEAFAWLVALSQGDPDGNGRADTWALSSYGGADWDPSLVAQMFRVPNEWRLNADGTLTSAIETEEYRQAIAYLRRLFEEGVYHPDSAGMTWEDARAAFLAGTTGLFSGGFGPFFGDEGLGAQLRTVVPTARLAGLVPPGHDGGVGVTHSTSGFFGFTAIPADRDEGRVRELLRILDYLAAPVGSEEWLFLNYGLEGVHHTVDADGIRQLNERGVRERSHLSWMVTCPYFFYYPTAPGDAAEVQRLAAESLALGIEDPTAGLYSPTAVEQAAILEQLQTDRVVAIVTGREPLDTLEAFIRDWRDRGGDRIRQEYERALAEGS
jgi:putative aldouronate transport system substrate-binding protein